MSWVDGLSVASAARDVATIAFFRALPVLGFVLLTRRIGLTGKVVVAASTVLLGVAVNVASLLPLFGLLATYTYLIGVAALVPYAVKPLREGALTRGGLFAACAGAFLVLPGLFMPGAARAAAVLLGWDVMLSSYSYAVELSASGAAPARGDCLFFLLVNPTLVYTDRGIERGGPTVDGQGLGRTALGLATLFASAALLLPAAAYVKEHSGGDASFAVAAGSLVAFAALRLLVEYGRHAGLASLQIGLLRQLGHELPERYRFPLGASTPVAFWQRWNTYVGGWLARYVFWPTVGRRRGARKRAAITRAHAVGVLVTFAAIGILHDVCPYFSETGRVGVGLAVFSAMGAVIVAWAAGARLLSGAAARAGAPWLMRAAPLLARLSFWVVALGAATWLLD